MTMKVLPALTVLEFAFQVAQAGGPGHCVMAFSIHPMPRDWELHFVDLRDEDQYEAIIERMQEGVTRVYRVLPLRPV